AALDDPHRPHAGIDPLPDVGDSVPHLHGVLHTGDLQRLQVFKDHVGIGTAPAAHPVGADPEVGGVAQPGGLGCDNVHHGVGIAGGGADLQPHLPQGGRCFHRKRLGCGKPVQDGEELGLKQGVHSLHVLLPRGAAVGLLPGPGDALHPEHGADVVPLQHTHGLTGLLQGDRHAVVGEGLLKGLDG
ncbi:hypothetical protein HEAFMP_HEAFMP_11925, partial [Dysosmobacter welbionis]